MLQRIYLSDFKSHKETELFIPKQGIFAILGKNYVGKTSIVQAVGIALFNYKNASKYSDYIRTGCTVSKIEIDFLSPLDQTTLRVHREIRDKTNKWWVEREDTLLCQGMEATSSFLREQFQIPTHLKLDLFFKEMIGVPQGESVSLFQASSNVRKEFFDLLFGQIAWREAAKELSSLCNKKIQTELHDLERLQSRLQGEMSSFELLLRDQKELEKQKNLLLKERQSKQHDLQKVQSQIQFLTPFRDEWEQLFTQFGSACQRKDRLQAEYKELESSRIHIQQQTIVSAQQAKESELYKELQGLEPVLVSQQNEMLSRLSLQKQEQLVLEIYQLESQKKQWKEDLQQIHWIEKNRMELEQNSGKYKQLQQECFELGLQKKQWESTAKQTEILKEKIIDLEKRSQALQESIQQPNQETLLQLEAQEEASFQKWVISQNKIQELEQIIPLAEKRICPYLRTSCQNLSKEPYLLEEVLKQEKQEWEDLCSLELRPQQKLLHDKKKQLEHSDPSKKWTELQSDLLPLRIQFIEKQKEMDVQVHSIREIEEKEHLLHVWSQLPKMTDAFLSLLQTKKELLQEMDSLSDLLEAKKRELEDFRVWEKEERRLSLQIQECRKNQKSCMDSYLWVLHLASKQESLEQMDELCKRKFQEIGEVESLLFCIENKRQQSPFCSEKWEVWRKEEQEHVQRLEQLEYLIRFQEEQLATMETQMNSLRMIQTQAAEAEKIWEQWNQRKEVLQTVAKALRFVGPEIATQLRGHIEKQANHLYGKMVESVQEKIIFNENYELSIHQKEESKSFPLLAGSEQTLSVLAIRVAMLQEFSCLNFAFFDEPTSFLDEAHRDKLAEELAHLQLKQTFVISHNDSFSPYFDSQFLIEREEGCSSYQAEP